MDFLPSFIYCNIARPYPIIELELSQPLPSLSIQDRETGIALILRYQDKPIGFVMLPLAPKTTLTPEALAKLLDREIAEKLLQEKVQAELLPTQSTPTLPTVTVAICTKDRTDNLTRCLNSLLKLQLPTPDSTPQFEILVVDNAPSDDRTQQLVETLPSVRYTREPKPGLDFARNRAIQVATGEVLAYLDDDVVVDRGWFAGLMTAWAENPDAAAFTGLVLPYELETEAQILFEQRGGFRRGFNKLRYYGQSLPGNPVYPCGAGIFGAGCNMAFRREILLKLGGFDEALDTGAPLPGGGDLDIFYRVVRSDNPLVYEPQYLVFHQHRRELSKLRRQYWSWGAGFMAFVSKCYQDDPSQRGKLQSLILWWFQYQFDQLVQSLTTAQIRHPRMVLAEFWGGIVGLLGEYGRSIKRIEKIHQQFVEIGETAS